MVMNMKHRGGPGVRVADELWKGEDRHFSDSQESNLGAFVAEFMKDIKGETKEGENATRTPSRETQGWLDFVNGWVRALCFCSCLLPLAYDHHLQLPTTQIAKAIRDIEFEELPAWFQFLSHEGNITLRLMMGDNTSYKVLYCQMLLVKNKRKKKQLFNSMQYHTTKASYRV